MKNKIKIILISLFAFAGCSDFLEEEPYSFLSPENLFNTEEGAELALVGVYENLSSNNPSISGSFNRGMLIVANFGTDDFVARSNTGMGSEYDNYTLLTNDNNLDAIWKNFYSGINQATSIIEKLPASDIPEEKKEQFIAEAKFLRGFFNFYLVRLFGSIPLITSEIESLEAANKPKASIQEIYEQIIADLTEAEPFLPGKANTPQGRATRAAALGFLTKIHLTLGSYGKYGSVPGYEWVDSSEAFAKAVEYGEQTLSIPGYSLSEDYSEIFENDNSSEIIFAAQMFGGSGYSTDGSFVANLFAPQNQGNINASRGGQARAVPTMDLYQKYEEGDTRRDWNIVEFRYRGCEEHPHPGGLEITDPPHPNVWAYAGKWRKPCGYDGVHFSTGHDIPLLRLADVMLMVAEAEAELNGGEPTERALELVNQLREARYEGDVTPEEPSGNFLDFIFDERSRELAYEGQRWFDLVRTNRLIDAIKNLRPIMGNPLGANNIQEFHHLFPIPQNEIDNNSSISQEDQNPGY